MNDWFKEFDGAVTVCDPQGIILHMNDKSVLTFAKYGGAALIGQSLVECHPEPARTKLLGLLKTQGRNVYTIEKQGVKKLIYQGPWFQDGKYGGLVELSLEIPMEMPHFVRQ
jgi:transcriptional regulator with PAS, ATPase and Fis domain